ncbi:density-regulated protein DRP1 [Hesseltinella vesiculosa]|uniref:Translation machinery-associated protein 22 n=1 Tax=Hesseltinella vesiculosa TaxID=101127 RepID=A0A1X2GUJ1_9FUNG|nr:density-regulated protein DRP1 [Hesseltinella vesiculosa]
MEPQHVLYCGVCTMPLEFCEFSGTQEKCREWLKDNHEELYEEIYEVQTLTEKLETTTVTGEGDGKSDRTFVKDKSAKLEAKLERENKKKMSSKVMIKRVERTKRKRITIIHGLEIFDVDLKKAAKLFANKFACGASVAKNNQNQDEIVVQGDFSDEVLELIMANWPHVPEENVECVDEKKEKKKK